MQFLYLSLIKLLCFIQCSKHKQAKQVVTFFTKVANSCFEMSNFNSSMAILTGLSLGPVTRLKKVWHKLRLQELEKLQVRLLLLFVGTPVNPKIMFLMLYTTV